MQPPKDTIPYGFCHCGCGERTEISKQNHKKHSYKKGEPKFYVHRHGKRLSVTDYVVDPDTGCHRWQRSISKITGYGRIGVGRKVVSAHVFFYEQKYGAVPDGMVLDHVYDRGCRYRDCVNTDHLEPVTHARNNRRGKQTKLTDMEVEKIRSMAGTMLQREIGAMFGITQSHVSRIISRDKNTWKESP